MQKLLLKRPLPLRQRLTLMRSPLPLKKLSLATAEAARSGGHSRRSISTTTNQAISDAITAGDAAALNLANAQKTIDTARLAAAQDDLADATTAMRCCLRCGQRRD